MSWSLRSPSASDRVYTRPLGLSEAGFYYDRKFNGTADIVWRYVLQETVREAGNIGGREVPVCVMSVRILVLLLPFYRTHARKSHTPVVFLSFVVMPPAHRARPPDSRLFIR